MPDLSYGRASASCPAEDDASVGDGLHLVLRVVGVGVVSGAEQASVLDGGLAASGPGGVVVDVAERCGPVAALCGAVLVAVADGDALGLGVEPGAAALVEDLGLAAEHEGDDAGLAGELPRLGGGDGVAGVEVGGCFAAAE